MQSTAGICMNVDCIHETSVVSHHCKQLKIYKHIEAVAFTPLSLINITIFIIINIIIITDVVMSSGLFVSGQ